MFGATSLARRYERDVTSYVPGMVTGQSEPEFAPVPDEPREPIPVPGPEPEQVPSQPSGPPADEPPTYEEEEEGA